MNRHWSIPTRYFALSLILVVLALIAWYMREMFAPLILAGVIAYLLYPVVELMCTRLRMRRKVAANIVFFLGLAALIAIPATLLPVLSRELKIVVADLLEVFDQVETYLSSPLEIAGMQFNLETFVPAFRESISGLLTPLPEKAWHFIAMTTESGLWFLVIVVGTYYFMTDWERLREWVVRLSPESYRQDIRRLYLEIKEVWIAYLRGQVTLMLIVGIVFSIIWSIIGLPGALILGILGGLFSLVPDVGPFAATVLAFIVALLEGSTWLPLSNFWFAMLVAGLYVVLINIKSIWLRPLILGRSVHMHEGLVFVAILAAVLFSGILGAFIIVPVLASVGVVGRYLRRRILGLPPFSLSAPLGTATQPEPRMEDKAPKTKLQPRNAKTRKG